MPIVNNLLSNTLYKIGWRQQYAESALPFDNGAVVEELKADALLMKEDNRVVLVIDQEFDDVPGWIEYDAGSGEFALAMTQGQVAVLSLDIPNDDLEPMKLAQRLLLITNVEDKKLMHFLPFLLRN